MLNLFHGFEVNKFAKFCQAKCGQNNLVFELCNLFAKRIMISIHVDDKILAGKEEPAEW